VLTGDDVEVAVVLGVLVAGATVGVLGAAALEVAGRDDGDELAEDAGRAGAGRQARTQSIFICEDPGPTAGV
jgi:hypothetical protein